MSDNMFAPTMAAPVPAKPKGAALKQVGDVSSLLANLKMKKTELLKSVGASAAAKAAAAAAPVVGGGDGAIPRTASSSSGVGGASSLSSAVPGAPTVPGVAVPIGGNAAAVSSSMTGISQQPNNSSSYSFVGGSEKFTLNPGVSSTASTASTTAMSLEEERLLQQEYAHSLLRI